MLNMCFNKKKGPGLACSSANCLNINHTEGIITGLGHLSLAKIARKKATWQ